MDDRLRAICLARGAFLTREALALGYDDRTLARMVRIGVLHRIRRGAYTFGDIWASADERTRHAITARAAVRVAKTPVAVSHVTAVLEHTETWWGLDLSDVHLTRLDGHAGRAEAGVRQHQGVVVHGDVLTRGPLLVTSPTRAALELTTLAGSEAALVSIDAMLHAGSCTLEGLRTRSASMTHWPGSLTTELVLQRAEPRHESAGESRSDYLFWKQELPRPVPQYPIHDRSGRLIARLDFAWPSLRVWVEFDGESKYSDHLRPGETVRDMVLREKRREDLVRELTGWICIRITWADLARPRATAARIREAFARQLAA